MEGPRNGRKIVDIGIIRAVKTPATVTTTHGWNTYG